MATQPTQGQFQKPDLSQLPVIQQMDAKARDAYQRVVAAGMKLMYSPEMRAQVQQAVQSQDPIPKKLATNVAGLMLTLDQKSQGGIPVAAIFPAAIDLLGEAAELLTQAGQAVTEADYHDAALMLTTILAKKLGIQDQQLMQGLEQSIPGESEPAAAPPSQGAIGMLGAGGAQ